MVSKKILLSEISWAFTKIEMLEKRLDEVEKFVLLEEIKQKCFGKKR